MSRLEGRFEGKVKAKNVDATTPASRKVVEKLGFERHGLVVRSTDGKVLWKQADHKVSMDEVRGAIRKLLEKRGS